MSSKISRLQRTCAICACSDLMPCNDRGAPCHWVTATLCSACCRKHCPSIFGHDLDARQRQGIANAAIRVYKRVRARAPKEAHPDVDESPAGPKPHQPPATPKATQLDLRF
jgi:hypothetical protein